MFTKVARKCRLLKAIWIEFISWMVNDLEISIMLVLYVTYLGALVSYIVGGALLEQS
jgi:hypothetical protein